MISPKHLLTAAALFALPLAASAAPVISSVSPTTATVNVPVTMTATVSSASPVFSCRLYVDLNDVGEMNFLNGTASLAFTFPYGGSRIAFVFCRDTGGAMAAGPNTAIWVNGATQDQNPYGTNPTPAPTPAPTPTNPTARILVKTACATNATPDDPCRAVYYVGTDGKRHAFPNSKVFFTWYQNFNGVQVITADQLAAYPLGKNVTYRPGVRMVKFTTDPKVYAVAQGGDLRWISTEAIASAYYGASWNQMIDDIPDTFYTNYTFGAAINSAGDYSPTAEMAAAVTID
jgi:hypothetical protein